MPKSTDLKPPIQVTPPEWQIIQTILKTYLPNQTIWAVGSRAKFKAKPHSDLDLVIFSEKPMSLDIETTLVNAFSDSDLPWRVDIIDWATTTPTFKEIILRDKVVIQN